MALRASIVSEEEDGNEESNLLGLPSLLRRRPSNRATVRWSPVDFSGGEEEQRLEEEEWRRRMGERGDIGLG